MGPFNIAEPDRLAPDLTPEQRAAMAPGDLLIRYVVPRLFDKINFLEYDLKIEIISLQQRLRNLEEVNTRLLTILHSGHSAAAPEDKAVEKPKRGRRKVETAKAQAVPEASAAPPAHVNISSPVAMSSIAKYDVESDTWVPKVVEGVPITASVVRAIISPDGETESFPSDVAVFVYNLSDDARNLLCATFPDENQEESF